MRKPYRLRAHRLRRRAVLSGLVAALVLPVGTGVGATPSAAAASGGAVGRYERLPTAAELESALLTPEDLGGRATVVAGSGSANATTITGCAPLVAVLNAPGRPRGQARVELATGGPYLTQALTTKPAARLAADYGRVRDAVRSCRRLTFSSGGTVLDFALRPVRFGGSGVAADRMDAVVQGVPVSGYLAVGRLGPVILGCTSFQVGGNASRLALAFWRAAVDKVRQVIPATAPVQPE